MSANPSTSRSPEDPSEAGHAVPTGERSLSSILWADITGIYDAILAHPFLTGLSDGTLPEDAFAYYVIQDAHYLRDYARALAVVGAKAPDDVHIAMFTRHAAGAVEVERSLHEGFFADLGIDPAVAQGTPVGPATRAYTSYLLATAHGGSYAEGLAAVLPCYWIYREVGTALLERGSTDARYQRWIDTYGGEDFAGIVREVLAATDHLGATTADAERARMRAHFLTTSRYEWMFWDAAWHRLAWPTAVAG